ncbi:MAG TPA: SPOR domain-containing protein [Legionellaceae bacterium]|nr:SPOR domain-containing protein [Legionellaceae bacterium]
MRFIMAKQFERKPTKTQHGHGLNAVWLCFITFIFGYLAASWCDVNQLVHWMSTHIQGQANTQETPHIEAKASKPIHPKLEFYTLLANESQGHSDTEKSAITTADLQIKEVPASSTVQSVPKDKENLPTPSFAEKSVSELPKSKTALKDDKISAPMELALTQSVSEPIKAKPSPVAAPKSVPAMPKVLANGHYSIQVGSFRALTEAQRMKAKLMMKGFGVEIVTVNQQSTYWYRVMIGPFASLPQARQAQTLFAQQEHINGMIRKLDV